MMKFKAWYPCNSTLAPLVSVASLPMCMNIVQTYILQTLAPRVTLLLYNHRFLYLPYLERIIIVVIRVNYAITNSVWSYRFMVSVFLRKINNITWYFYDC